VQDGKRVTYDAFRADMDAGDLWPPDFQSQAWSLGFGPGFNPPLQTDSVYLRWSDDRGHTFGNPVAQRLGPTGNYLIQPSWRQLGLARDRVFELLWAVPAFTALQGAWIDVTPAGS
jgi:hypothetical protein